jgi:predicted nucleic acid-binding protein
VKRIVVDASVAIKWLVPHKPEEADIGKALALFEQIACQDRLMVQPPHFIPEVMAVIARVAPDYADRLFIAVSNLEMTIENNANIYQMAIRLSIELNHHLFDTLYHAVALHTPGATLITADEAYYRKAQGMGKLVRLQDYAG